MRIFRPCHMRVDMALPGQRSFTALFFNTPMDEKHTRGNMFVYKAINEDLHLLSDFFDGFLNRYHRWQRYSEEKNLWFKGFDHMKRGAEQ
jgi:hypothetical protein